MEWIVRIEGEENKNKRIKVVFNPLEEKIIFCGEYKFKTNWNVFSRIIHEKMEISLEEIQEKMEAIVFVMNKRIDEFENLNKGFSVLKWIALKNED
jgi:hypothetical protein